jgi:hypothetical protein
MGTLGFRTLHRLAGGPTAKPSWDWRASTPKQPGADSPCAVHKSGARSTRDLYPALSVLGVLGTSTLHSQYSEYSGPLPGTLSTHIGALRVLALS